VSAGTRASGFACVPEGVLELSSRAVQMYAWLDRHANDADVAWPSRERLAWLSSCSLRSVDRALDELASSGFVLRRKQPPPKPTRYVLVRRPRIAARSDGVSSAPIDPSRNGSAPAFDGVSSAPIAEGNKGSAGDDTVSARHPERELVNEGRARARAGARARVSSNGTGQTPDDRARLRALELGEAPVLERWLRNVGAEYAHDEATFGEACADELKISSPDVVTALLVRARGYLREREATHA